jgi:hypothetical protein
MKLDYELQGDKIERLTKELEDLSSLNQDNQELMQLKRQKNELERKALDQEEELDEQAGTIQQLEQVGMQELSKDACLSTHILKLPDQFSGA